MDRLPFEPEPMKEIKERFVDALRPDVEIGAVLAGLVERPGQLRRHVFDFKDGMRMIASMDRHGDERCVHVSFSSHRPIKRRSDYVKFCAKMKERLEELIGRPVDPLERKMSSAAIHFAFKPEEFEHLFEQTAVAE